MHDDRKQRVIVARWGVVSVMPVGVKQTVVVVIEVGIELGRDFDVVRIGIGTILLIEQGMGSDTARVVIKLHDFGPRLTKNATARRTEQRVEGRGDADYDVNL